MRSVGIVAGLGLVVAVAALSIVIVLSLSNDTSWTDLGTGDCFDLAGEIDGADGDLAEVMAVDTVDCDDPHDAEVVAVGELNPGSDRAYPADEPLFAEIDEACEALVPASVDRAVYGILPIAPDERTWADRAGRFACVAVVAGGGTVTGSALG